MKKTKARFDPVERFLALSDKEKAAELAPFERGAIPLSESRPLNADERKMWNRIQRRLQRSRPRLASPLMRH
jgi:hypothetical protein